MTDEAKPIDRKKLIAARVRATPYVPNMICVWDFHLAAQEFRDLSEHGGDEDWVVYVPPGVSEPMWLFTAPFYYEPQKFDLGSEYGVIYISAHA